MRKRVSLPKPCIDSRDVHVDERTVTVDGLGETLSTDAWDGSPLEFDFTLDSDRTPVSLGFYEREEFGTWSRVEEPIVILPHMVQGRIAMRLACRGFGPSVGRRIRVSLGNSAQEFEISLRPATVTLLFDVTEPTAEIRFSGIIAKPDAEGGESRTLGIGVSTIELRCLDDGAAKWDGVSTGLSLVAEGNQQLWSLGFYYLEPWGAWSQDETVSLVLPWSIGGRVRLTLDVVGTGPSVGQELVVNVGGCERSFVLEGGESLVHLEFNAPFSSAMVTITGLIARATPGLEDQRTIGVGLRTLTVEDCGRRTPGRSRLLSRRAVSKERHRDVHVGVREVELSGLVYYTELSSPNLASGDWISVVSAFVWTFKENPNATLIVAVPGTQVDVFCARYLFHFSRMRDPRCRVIMCCLPDEKFLRKHLAPNIDCVVFIAGGDPSTSRFNLFHSLGIRAIVATDPEQANGSLQNVVCVRPMMRPKRVTGSATKVERQLVPTIDWDQMTESFRTTGGVPDVVSAGRSAPNSQHPQGMGQR